MELQISEMYKNVLLSKKTLNPCFTNPNHSLFKIMQSLQQIPELKELIILLKMEKNKQYDFIIGNEVLQTQIKTQILALISGGVSW
jgi:hypothetical protein